MSTPLLNWRPSPKLLAKQKRSLDRRAKLSEPITLDEIVTFTERLIAISFCADSECWFYIGERKATNLSSMTVNTNAYASFRRDNGAVLLAHRFAFAASEGVPPSEIDDLNIHHVRKCWGYRCSNPDHLDVLEPREHAREHAADLDRLEYAHLTKEEKARRAGIVAQRHEDMVHTLLLDTPPRERRPAEFEKVTGAACFQRCFAGLPFMIRRGEIGSVTAELLQPENEAVTAELLQAQNEPTPA